MIPVLYKGTETEFETQGLGSLTDAIECKVTEELNSTYELKLVYPVDGIHFDELQLGRIILADPAPRKYAQPFFIYKISKPINGKVTVNAEHISYRLSYIPVAPFSASNCAEALNGLVSHALEACPFTVWTDKDLSTPFALTAPQSFRTCLGGVEGSILDTFRGEYEFDRFAVKLYTNRGSLKETAQIVYGKNLTDLTQDETIENTVTGIVPYWIGGGNAATDGSTTTETVVTLPEYVVESEYTDKYPYNRTIVHDFSSDFQEQPTVDQLRARCKEYMRSKLTGVPQVTLTVSFVSLADSTENQNFANELVYLGDRVPVYFDKLGIATTAEVTSATYDVLVDRYDSLTLGSVASSLSKTITEIGNNADQSVSRSDLSVALAVAQKIIAGGAGGYRVTRFINGHPAETIYGDTDDVNTMVNCMRENMNGIAFSHNGINGPYVTAWTIDGGFNADFINTGTLRAINIEGVNIKGTTIEGGTITGSEIDGINMYGSAITFGEKASKYRVTAQYKEEKDNQSVLSKGVYFNSFDADSVTMFFTDRFNVNSYTNPSSSAIYPMLELAYGYRSSLFSGIGNGVSSAISAYCNSTTTSKARVLLSCSNLPDDSSSSGLVMNGLSIDDEGVQIMLDASWHIAPYSWEFRYADGSLHVVSEKNYQTLKKHEPLTITFPDENAEIHALQTLNLTGKDVTVQGLRPVKCKDNGHEIYFRWNGSSLIAAVDVTDVWSTSDRRLKDLIETINNDYLDAIGSVEIKQFIFTDPIYDKSIKHFGVIAQDVREALQEKNIDPESIAVNNHFDRDGEEFYGIDKEEFLMARVAYDEKRIKDLEERIEALERKINA